MGIDPTFRVAQESDLDTVLALMQDLSREDPLPDQRALDSFRARSALTELVNDPSRGAVWLICDGDAPVGYLALTFGYSLEFHGRDAFIDELYIRPAHRGRGWGTRAMSHAETVARTANVRAVHLEVGRRNVAAQAFDRKVGYADHDRYLMTKWIVDEKRQPPPRAGRRGGPYGAHRAASGRPSSSKHHKGSLILWMDETCRCRRSCRCGIC
jgi:ribosomal protein S18 acetylase RimI-like enzyme